MPVNPSTGNPGGGGGGTGGGTIWLNPINGIRKNNNIINKFLNSFSFLFLKTQNHIKSHNFLK